ncbi:lutropin subunit beta [Acinonyx jubatus]|uniref:Luteinizing hormone subunit beta n=3 Tax=Laurasiatheria TaxID=314145 RepID=A0ABM3P321_ACIJB|nr:lutropin subunit beta [Acinonyx jubatus]
MPPPPVALPPPQPASIRPGSCEGWEGKGPGYWCLAGPETLALSQGLLLLWLLLNVGGVWTSRGPLRPLCRPINATLAAENEACPVCVTFTTTICAGYCPSMMRVLPAALPPVPQPVCTYRELRFASVRLPGCPPGVDPVVSFPVALSCRCGPCRLSSSDCGGPRAQPLACDRPPLPGLLFL